MQISRDTRIAELIAHQESTIETLVSVSSRFKKLRNPALRKVMAGQVSIAMAARVGGVSEQAIFDALASIGFQCHPAGSGRSSEDSGLAGESRAEGADPARLPLSEEESTFKIEFESGDRPIIDLDVRPMMDQGQEPLSKILKSAEQVAVGQGLRIINSFAPEPLIALLRKKGFEGYIYPEEDCFHACFIRRGFQRVPKADKRSGEENHPYRQSPETPRLTRDGTSNAASIASSPEEDSRDAGRRSVKPTVTETGLQTADGADRAVVRLDVRGMTPPGPMVKILKTLESLSSTQQLYVLHERIPRFLFPQLAEQGYVYRTSERGQSDVRLLIGRRP